jgi:Zn-dependent M16 (insulinase) family peptidase
MKSLLRHELVRHPHYTIVIKKPEPDLKEEPMMHSSAFEHLSEVLMASLGAEVISFFF